ncbi:MAG: cytochrome P460 family protein [Hyphomicrobium sp.]|uniref:cytochrome P460 family protein n=1 Tax=Hyphomicrobium sp. TaxID=82 RepID=UPI0039E2349D
MLRASLTHPTKIEPAASVAMISMLLIAGGGLALAASDKYSAKVPGGLSFSEFRGYEDWQTVAVSQTESAMAVILANPAMIEAYRSGIPENGKPFPEGSKIAKVHWTPTQSKESPSPATVPGELQNVDFIVKDSKRFADSGGWGYAAFIYDPKSDSFSPATTADSPPQENDAKCGYACHTIVQAKDYIFTAYPKR